jgi:hypothetical protein
LSIVFERLKTVWSHYLWQKALSEKDGSPLPSTMACHPAPGRRLLIIRNDHQVPTSSLLSFDGLLGSDSESPQTAHKRHSYAGLSRSDSTDHNISESSVQKRRWSLLGKIIPFANSDNAGQSQDTNYASGPKPSPLEQVRNATAVARTRPSLNTQHRSSSSSSINSDSALSIPTHRTFSFKFSLEWTQPLHQVPPHMYNLGSGRASSQAKLSAPPQNRRLSPPRLPAPAHTWLLGQLPEIVSEVPPRKPTDTEARYAGRALAEWSLVVMECNNFVERRRAEGVPTLKLLEVPSLGVEGFRKLG